MNIFKKRKHKTPDGTISYKIEIDDNGLKEKLRQIEKLLLSINKQLKTFDKKTNIVIKPLTWEDDWNDIANKMTDNLKENGVL